MLDEANLIRVGTIANGRIVGVGGSSRSIRGSEEECLCAINASNGSIPFLNIFRVNATYQFFSADTTLLRIDADADCSVTSTEIPPLTPIDGVPDCNHSSPLPLAINISSPIPLTISVTYLLAPFFFDRLIDQVSLFGYTKNLTQTVDDATLVLHYSFDGNSLEDLDRIK